MQELWWASFVRPAYFRIGFARRRRTRRPRPHHLDRVAQRIWDGVDCPLSRRRIGGTYRRPGAQHGDGGALAVGAGAPGLPANSPALRRFRRGQEIIMNPLDEHDEGQIEALLSAAARDAAPPDPAFLERLRRQSTEVFQASSNSLLRKK